MNMSGHFSVVLLMLLGCGEGLSQDSPKPHRACNEANPETPAFIDTEAEVWKLKDKVRQINVSTLAYAEDLVLSQTPKEKDKKTSAHIVFIAANLSSSDVEDYLESLQGPVFVVAGGSAPFKKVKALASEHIAVTFGYPIIKIGNKTLRFESGLPASEVEHQDHCGIAETKEPESSDLTFAFSRASGRAYYAWPIPERASSDFIGPRNVGVTLRDSAFITGPKTVSLP